MIDIDQAVETNQMRQDVMSRAKQWPSKTSIFTSKEICFHAFQLTKLNQPSDNLRRS